MDSKIINTYPIREYLAGLNIYPTKDKGYYGMFNSPFREDKDASLKVDYNKNLWIDFGSNEGGTLIDLVMRMENCSNSEAMRLLEQKLSGTDSFSFHRNNVSETVNPTKDETTIHITNVKDLTNPALLAYLHERSITSEVAKVHCVEVHYTVKDKPYFAIGFRNDSGGYDLRNKYFQGCISPKEITHLRQKNVSDSSYVFEGFMDFLSFLVLRKRANPDIPNIDKQDYIILNSVINTSKALPKLADYRNIHCFLDNDDAGLRALQKIRQEYGVRVVDVSKNYANHKDLNDYLCSRSVPKPTIKMKSDKGKGLRM